MLVGQKNGFHFTYYVKRQKKFNVLIDESFFDISAIFTHKESIEHKSVLIVFDFDKSEIAH